MREACASTELKFKMMEEKLAAQTERKAKRTSFKGESSSHEHSHDATTSGADSSAFSPSQGGDPSHRNDRKGAARHKPAAKKPTAPSLLSVSIASSEDPEYLGDDSSDPEDDGKGGGGGGGGGGGSDGGHSDDSLLSAAALSYRPSKRKDSGTMKSLGNIPSNIADWQRYRRTAFRTVSCACGTPQRDTDMLLAAEAHTSLPHKLKVHEPWEKCHGPLSGPSHGCHDGPIYDP